MLSTEEGHFTRSEAREDWRLSCQVAVKQDMAIKVPEDAFGVQRWECTVESNENVATFIKELVLKLPEGANVDFRAGGFVQLEIPPYAMSYEQDIDVQPEFREDWDKFKIWRYTRSSSWCSHFPYASAHQKSASASVPYPPRRPWWLRC